MRSRRCAVLKMGVSTRRGRSAPQGIVLRTIASVPDERHRWPVLRRRRNGGITTQDIKLTQMGMRDSQ